MPNKELIYIGKWVCGTEFRAKLTPKKKSVIWDTNDAWEWKNDWSDPISTKRLINFTKLIPKYDENGDAYLPDIINPSRNGYYTKLDFYRTKIKVLSILKKLQVPME